MSGQSVHSAVTAAQRAAEMIRAGAGYGAVPLAWPDRPWSPLRNVIPRAVAARELLERQRAEERGRRAWLRDVKHRLGLVHPGEVLHRAVVRRESFRWEQRWAWSCRVPGCAFGAGYASQAAAFADACDHAAGRLEVLRGPPGTVTVRR